MEVFPLDIQRMLLRHISNKYVENLRHLYCVNRMFRRWVSRYVIDTLDKEWFLDRVLVDMGLYKVEYDFSDWNIFEKLSQQWSGKSPTLLSSFVMYLHANRNLHLKISDRCSNKLFYTKQSILKDVKKKSNQITIRLTQNRVIEREQEIILAVTVYLPTFLLAPFIDVCSLP